MGRDSRAGRDGLEKKSRHEHASIERLYEEGGGELDLHETRTVAIVSVRDVMLTTLRNVHAHKRCVICLCGWGNPCSWIYEVPNGVQFVSVKNCLFVVLLFTVDKRYSDLCIVNYGIRTVFPTESVAETKSLRAPPLVRFSPPCV